ncbi:MAG: PpiC-type peptidyl-prolyl cis-trans isomerase [Rariglobus sp.]|jgi:hypothetical protein|nr:PpiC-type peptidyl-prolyl cis-trans isomerase [Rariglobus sp.]
MNINGLPISISEYKLIMHRRTAAIYNYFKQSKDMDDRPGYWNDDGSPENPIKKLRETVEEELVRIKVIQGLAIKNGLLEDGSYTAFLRSLNIENERRRNALVARQPIYGPQRHREAAYYYILLGDLDHKLQGLMAREPGHEIPEAAILAYYNAHKDEIGQRTLAEVRLKIIQVLQKQTYDKMISDLCVQAKIEKNIQALQEVTPRSDT